MKHEGDFKFTPTNANRNRIIKVSSGGLLRFPRLVKWRYSCQLPVYYPRFPCWLVLLANKDINYSWIE